METLVLAGDLSALSPARDYVRSVAQAVGLPDKSTYALTLAVDELVTNIVTHGYEEQGKTGKVYLSEEVDHGDLLIHIEDEAPPFDPSIRKNIHLVEHVNKPLEERPIGGLGIYLAVQSLDRFDYHYRNGRNTNTVGMHLEDSDDLKE